MPVRKLVCLDPSNPFIHYYNRISGIPGPCVRTGDIIRKSLRDGGVVDQFYFVGSVGASSFAVHPIGDHGKKGRWSNDETARYMIAGRLTSEKVETTTWCGDAGRKEKLPDLGTLDLTSMVTWGRPGEPSPYSTWRDTGMRPTYYTTNIGDPMSNDHDFKIRYLDNPQTVDAWVLKPFDVIEGLGKDCIVDSVTKDVKGVWYINTKRPGSGHITAFEAVGEFKLVGHVESREMEEQAQAAVRTAADDLLNPTWTSVPKHLKVRFEDLPQGAVFRTSSGLVGRKTSNDKYRTLLSCRGGGLEEGVQTLVGNASPDYLVEYHGARTVARVLRGGSTQYGTVSAQVRVKYQIPKPGPTLYQRCFDICSPRRIEDLHLSVVLPLDPEAKGVKVSVPQTTQAQYTFWFSRIVFTSPNKDDLNEIRITNVLSYCGAVVNAFSDIEEV